MLDEKTHTQSRTALPTRWRNWFRVFDVEGETLENNGLDVLPGLHEDVNLFASKDEAETFAQTQMASHRPAVRAHYCWVGAFPDGETP